MKRKLFILSVTLGLLYDFLFWGGNQGISFFIFILAFLIFISSIFRELNPTKGKIVQPFFCNFESEIPSFL
jgi:hypothetical protein